MTELIKAFDRFDTALNQAAPKIASRLQPGLTRIEIEQQIVSFSWVLPQDACDLVLSDRSSTIYCMMRLDVGHPLVYCANGTKLPPIGVTESFLSAQTQFNRLSDLLEFLTVLCQQAIHPTPVYGEGLMDEIDCELDLTQFEELYKQHDI